MRPKSDNLITLLQSAKVLDIVATRLGCSVRALKAVGMLHKADCVQHRISTTLLAGLLGCCYETAKDGVREARDLGWIKNQVKRNGGIELTIEGARIAGVLVREEREARAKVTGANLPKWPRAYKRRAVV